MELTKNQKDNIIALISMSLDTYYTDISITKVDMFEDTFMCNVIRKVSKTYLQKIRDYFKVDIRDNNITYSLIVNKNTNIIKLTIEGIENYQLNMLDNVNELLEKLNNYNEKISNRLITYSKWLYETLYPTDDNILDWTFYYISHDKKHLGFANADLKNKNSFKIYVFDFYRFTNEKATSFYDNVFKHVGTKNDAEIMCMRRNYNSKFGSDWMICLYGTPIQELWID